MKNNKEEEGGKDEVARLKDILEVAREIKGGGGSKSTAEVIVDAVGPILGPVLNIVGNMMAIRAQATGAPTIPTKGVGEIVEMPKQSNGLQQITHSQVVAANPNEAAQIINQFKPIILNKLSEEGCYFGEWIAAGFGEMTAMAITRYGVDGLMTAAKSVPDFWVQIENTYGEEHLRKWLTSLVNYKEEIIRIENEAEGGGNNASE
jgi:hypothetical protein